MHILNVNLNAEQINSIFNILNNSNYDIEFLKDEINCINDSIKNNNYDLFLETLNEKVDIAKEIKEEMVLDKVDHNLWQYVMSESYSKWDDKLSRETFLEKLSPYEKLAVQFGNFNYQVQNGGLWQWKDNGYSSDLDDLKAFLYSCDFDKKDAFIDILENIKYIDDAIGCLDLYDDLYDDFYYEDREVRLKYLNDYDKVYYSFEEEWEKYFQKYLYDNLPDSYLKKIEEIDNSIPI